MPYFQKNQLKPVWHLIKLSQKMSHALTLILVSLHFKVNICLGKLVPPAISGKCKIYVLTKVLTMLGTIALENLLGSNGLKNRGCSEDLLISGLYQFFCRENLVDPTKVSNAMVRMW